LQSCKEQEEHREVLSIWYGLDWMIIFAWENYLPGIGSLIGGRRVHGDPAEEEQFPRTVVGWSASKTARDTLQSLQAFL